MTKLLFLILFLVVPLSFAKTLTIGTTAQNPPFNSLADQKDHFYGFDIDIMGEICRRIKVECKYKPFVFNDLFSAVSKGKLDLAVAAIIITPFRQLEFLFSFPYLESFAQFLTKKQSAINQAVDIENKTIGTRLGTPFAELARNTFKNKSNIIEYPDIAMLLDALNKGKVDVILMDAEAAKNWYANNNDVYKLVGTPIPVGSGYGIMANQNQTKLMATINQALLDMAADGTYLKIYNRYFVN